MSCARSLAPLIVHVPLTIALCLVIINTLVALASAFAHVQPAAAPKLNECMRGLLPEQALYQLAGLGATLAIAIAGGLLAATLVKYSDCTGQVLTAQAPPSDLRLFWNHGM